MRSVSESFNTDGSGLWSTEARAVKVIGLELYNIRPCEAELRVYIDTDSWDTEKFGSIDTDCGFLAELQDYLLRAGYSDAVDYAQDFHLHGDNYLAFDVDERFIETWNAK